MRMRDALAFVSVAILAACGRQPGAQVKMMGFTPNTGLQKDLREIRCSCPRCGALIEAGAERCGRKDCQSWISWAPKYRCGYCEGTGRCPACALMEKEGGKCANCKGAGYLTFRGRTPECPDCKGTKVCTICKGSQKCDFCGGEKEVAFETIKAKARKPGEAPAEEPAPAPAPEKKAEGAGPPGEKK